MSDESRVLLSNLFFPHGKEMIAWGRSRLLVRVCVKEARLAVL